MKLNGGKLDKCVVFFDFDNTITKVDVLDDMLERFSRDDKWLDLEEKWKRGEIGSRQCLDGQMRGISISRQRLDEYLKTIEIDSSFKKILELCGAKGIKTVILSDNFEYILKGILKHNGIEDIDVYCNSLEISGEDLTPDFPYRDEKPNGCAHCKTKNMLANLDPGYASVYIGDGLSDLCPSRKAELVFAKSTLKERLEKDNIPCVPFGDLGDVYEYLKRRL